jgi:hypothetical protein
MFATGHLLEPTGLDEMFSKNKLYTKLEVLASVERYKDGRHLDVSGQIDSTASLQSLQSPPRVLPSRPLERTRTP